MRLALLSGGADNDYAAALLETLAAAGHHISLVVVAEPTRAARVARRVARVGAAGLPGLWARRGGPTAGPAPVRRRASAPLLELLEARSVPHVTVADVNSAPALERLRAARPDAIVYAGAGILRRPLIEIPTVGVLNAHMGRLPAYRGMNVLEWSLLAGDPPVVTVHFIDAGIDTGRVLIERELAVAPGETIATLRERAVDASIEALAATLDGLDRGGLAGRDQEGGGSQYFTMHRRLKKVAEAALE